MRVSPSTRLLFHSALSRTRGQARNARMLQGAYEGEPRARAALGIYWVRALVLCSDVLTDRAIRQAGEDRAEGQIRGPAA